MKRWRTLLVGCCLALGFVAVTAPAQADRTEVNADLVIDLSGDASYAEIQASGLWKGPAADAVTNFNLKLCDEATDALQAKTRIVLALKNKTSDVVLYRTLWNKYLASGPPANCRTVNTPGFSSAEYDYIAMKAEYSYVPPNVNPWPGIGPLSIQPAVTIYETPWDYNPYYCSTCLNGR